MNKFIGPIVTAAVAAISSLITAKLAVPVWVMFIGWIAFIAGGASARTALPTLACSLLGVALGFVGTWIIGAVTVSAGSDLALIMAVFIIVLMALLANALPVANVVIAYFVGMTTFFASQLEPTLTSALMLGTGLAVGIVSGLGAAQLSLKLARPTTVQSS